MTCDRPPAISITLASPGLLPNPICIIRINAGIATCFATTIYYQLLTRLGQQTAAIEQLVKFRIKSKIILLDLITIPLYLSLFDWVKYKTTTGAI